MNKGNGNFIRKHNKDKNYTTIDNNIYKNKKLSLKAKGLMSMLLSFAENWEFSEAGLTTLSSDGRTSVRSGLVELEENGYLVRTQYRNEQGNFGGYVYNLYEIPITVKPLSENPTSVTEHNKELSNKELKELSTNEYSSDLMDFEIFWRAYPNQKSKGQAIKTFDKLVKEGVITQDVMKLILKDLEKRKGYENWLKEDGRYIPHPSTYLNALSWADVYEVSTRYQDKKPIVEIEMAGV